MTIARSNPRLADAGSKVDKNEDEAISEEEFPDDLAVLRRVDAGNTPGAGGLYYASPVAAGDYVYFASSEGVVTAIRAVDKLDVVARNDLGEPMFATPSIVENKIYVRTIAKLYAFAGGKGTRRCG